MKRISIPWRVIDAAAVPYPKFMTGEVRWWENKAACMPIPTIMGTIIAGRSVRIGEVLGKGPMIARVTC